MQLGGQCVIGLRPRSGVRSFFIPGVLTGHSGIVDMRLELIKILLKEVRLWLLN